MHQIELEIQNEELVQSRAVAEAALRQYTELYDFAPVGYFTLTRTGVIRQANLTGAKLLGVVRGQLPSQSLATFIAPAARPALSAFLENVFAGDGPPTCEVALHSDARRWVQLDATCPDSEARTVCHLVMSDITLRVRAEETVRRLQSHLSDIINSMPSVVIGVDHAGRVTQWNHRAKQETGLSASEVAGYGLQDAFSRLADVVPHVLAVARDRTVYAERRRRRRVGGENYYEDVTIYPLTGDPQGGAVIRLDDTTEHVKTEDRLRQSEKMLSLGGLAAGIAHELNNPLAGMVQNAEVTQRRLLHDLPANRYAAAEAGVEWAALQAYLHARAVPSFLVNIRAAGQRAATIVKNILSFAHPGRTDTTASLTEVLEQTVAMVQTEADLKKHPGLEPIAWVREYALRLPPLRCEPSKL